MKKIALAAALLVSVPLCADPVQVATPAPQQVNEPWSLVKGLFKTATGLTLLPVSAGSALWGLVMGAVDEGTIRTVGRDLNWDRDDIRAVNFVAKGMKLGSFGVSISALAGSFALFKGAYKDFKDVANS